jgi:biotin-[acetyl-CoA-carboxylase] ligase BirA-like protein
VLDQHVHLVERAFVEQSLDAFARGQFAKIMLAILGTSAGGFLRRCLQPAQLIDQFVGGHDQISVSVVLSLYDSQKRVMATPYVTIVRDVVPSTQDLAAGELVNSAVPVLVVAHEQTTGRGRRGNQWWQAPRAVAASLAFPAHRFPIEDTFSLAAGLAVRAAIDTVCHIAVELKWPNDIERNGLKVGGILVERDEERVVVGCGLNLFWPDPPDRAAGLLAEDPGAHLGVTISQMWATQVLVGEGRWDRSAYLEACSTIGAQVTWRPDGWGRVVDVDHDGALVVDTDTGQVTLRSGEVHTVRPTG